MKSRIAPLLNNILLYYSDKSIIFLSIIYITIPTVLFFLGWLKTPLAILLCISFIYFIYKIYLILCRDTVNLIYKDSFPYWVFTIIICAIWLLLSGIGGFCFQNYDHFSRNAIFRDLSNCSWPVFYDLSKESETVQQSLGSDKVALSYYFSWWLPVSSLSKLFHLGNTARNLLLYCWALLGILLVIYCINRYLKKCSYLVPIILICFSGLDIIPYYLINSSFTFTDHIEWWAGYFQYSSNTSQLFWVFNQAIPIWCVTAILLQSESSQYSIALSSLAFAYSPWATFSIIPIALYNTLKKKDVLKKSINICNILIPSIMLIVYGSFYLASNGSTGGYGFIFSKYPGAEKKLLCFYISFLLVEVGIYFFIISKYAHKYHFYSIILLELLLFPFFYIKDLDLCMRGSIPALFILMVFIIRFLSEPEVGNHSKIQIRKMILIFVLVIGAYTPFCEINRSIQKTLSASSKSEILAEEVYSLGDMHTDNSTLIETVNRLFFARDYADSFFFNRLAK